MGKEKRYYVQGLTDQIFVVRERALANEVSSANDHIVKSFQIARDAYQYAHTMNAVQCTPETVAPPEQSRLSEKPLQRV